MEFWGVEVKPGETLTCDPGEDKYLHLSQAAIGEIKDSKGNERASLFVHIDEKKLLLGTLSHGNCDQISLDLVFEKEFKLSHNLQSGSVFCCGYSTVIQDEEYGGLDGEDSESEDEELMPTTGFLVKENGKPGAGGAKAVKSEPNVAKPKPGKLEAAASGKEAPKGKPEEGKPSVKKDDDNSDEDEDESDDDEDDEDDEDEEMADLSDESDDEDEEDESEDEKGQATPKVEAAGKKRLLPDSATKSQATEKKAKLTTPAGVQKTGPGEGKKVGHVATPHPAKQGGKTPAVAVKQVTPVGKGAPAGSKQNTPGSKGTPKPNATPASEKKLGQFSCQSCSRSFTTESGLNSHNAAKHTGGK